MRKLYSDAFKSRMVKKMIGPHSMTGRALSLETGVSQASLSKWLREARSCSLQESKMTRKPQDRTLQEKLQIILQTTNLPEQELGVYLRKEGLHTEHLEQWREECLAATRPKTHQKKEVSRLKRENQKLEKELRRKDKALAEAAALLVLQKKVQALWGDGDENT